MRAACIQLNSGTDRSANLNRSAELLAEAAAQGAELALLPENFAFMGGSDVEKRAMAEDASDSPVVAFLQEQSVKHGMAVIGGSLLLKGGDGRVRNSSVAVGPDGAVLALYDKIHLFDVNVGDERYCESSVVQAGSSPVVAKLGEWRAGLSICYDLRFPELYRHYAEAGCQLLTVPAAFTHTTGMAHWQPLLQARAIENHCFVLAAAQAGTHPDGRKTWGHSMLIDPWGEVLCELPDGEGFILSDLSAKRLQSVRESMPVLQHRKL